MPPFIYVTFLNGSNPHFFVISNFGCARGGFCASESSDFVLA